MKYHWESHDYKKTGVDDMVLLSQISDAAIVDNLKKRFLEDCIYTSIGSVLVSVNPFKNLPIYDDKHVEKYQGAAQYENPPHVYALTDEMYRDMMIDSESQCVIISGESGAGKTVAAKYIMGYLTKVSGGGSKAHHLKDVILQSNPLLEAFGNAKTVRNDNSSRFGKYVEISFTPTGAPNGGQVTNFLLEKSRVVHQNSNERNFHIFYQLLKQQDPNYTQQLGLADPDYFEYLRHSGCSDVAGMNDSAEFHETVKAMKVMGLNDRQQMEIFSAVSAVLHLGNIRFVEDGNYVRADPETMAYPAYLLSVSDEYLIKKIESHTMESKWGSTTETTEILHNFEQATYARDALAKEIYSRLFNYVIQCVNNALTNQHPESDRIGILDIYGFEIFDRNGFEQFCINYVNEKLQQIFIDLTLKAEQEEYHSEGIKWTPIDYFNNKVVCDLIEGRNPPGLMSILDDVCLSMHAVSEGSDDTFLKKSRGAIGSHPHFNDSSKSFIIKHYAGNVEYDVSGFCVKNRDVLYSDLVQVMQSSSSEFLRSLFPEDTSGKIKTRPSTAGSKIKEQANTLVVALMKCTPHYIRCIKPNETKRAKDWEDKRVLHQVQYLGLKENVRVRRAGFAYRRGYDKFLRRYCILSEETWPHWNGDVGQGVQFILRSVGLDASHCQLGKTKLFIKAPESLFMLEEERQRRFDHYARVIQNAFRRHFAKRIRLKMCEETAQLLAGRKQRRSDTLSRNYTGDYIGVDSKPEVTQFIPRRCRVEFAQRISKFDRRFNKWDRDLILFSRGMIILGEEKPTKGADKGKTLTVKKREVRFEDILEIVLSPFQDGIVLLRVQGQFDSLLEITCKTEFLRALSRCHWHALNKELPLKFTQEFDFQLKNTGWGGGGTRKVRFELTQSSSEIVVLRPTRKILTILVAPALDANSRPALKTAARKPPANRPGFQNHNGPMRAAPALPRGGPPVNGPVKPPSRPPPPPPGSKAPVSQPILSPAVRMPMPPNGFLPKKQPSVVDRLNNNNDHPPPPPPIPVGGFPKPPPTASPAPAPPPIPVHGFSKPPQKITPPPPPIPLGGLPKPPSLRTLPSSSASTSPASTVSSKSTKTSSPGQLSFDELKQAIGAKRPANMATNGNPAGKAGNHADVKTKFNLRPTPNGVMNKSPPSPVTNNGGDYQLKKPPPGGGRPKPKPALPVKPKLASPPEKQSELGEALYPYNAKASDELTLKVGDIVKIVKKDPSGWWEGILDSKVGLFPGNYVKEMAD